LAYSIISVDKLSFYVTVVWQTTLSMPCWSPAATKICVKLTDGQFVDCCT